MFVQYLSLYVNPGRDAPTAVLHEVRHTMGGIICFNVKQILIYSTCRSASADTGILHGGGVGKGEG